MGTSRKPRNPKKYLEVDLIFHVGAGFDIAKLLNEFHIVHNHHLGRSLKMFHILAWVITDGTFIDSIADPEGPTTNFFNYFVVNAIAKIITCNRSAWTSLPVQVDLLHGLIDR